MTTYLKHKYIFVFISISGRIRGFFPVEPDPDPWKKMSDPHPWIWCIFSSPATFLMKYGLKIKLRLRLTLICTAGRNGRGDPWPDHGDDAATVRAARRRRGVLQLQPAVQDRPRHPQDVGQHSQPGAQQCHVAPQISSGKIWEDVCHYISAPNHISVIYSIPSSDDIFSSELKLDDLRWGNIP